ncbi:hypothetical protein VTK26DRAFT_4606 [Humicola hyalothermophila]
MGPPSTMQACFKLISGCFFQVRRVDIRIIITNYRFEHSPPYNKHPVRLASVSPRIGIGEVDMRSFAMTDVGCHLPKLVSILAGMLRWRAQAHSFLSNNNRLNSRSPRQEDVEVEVGKLLALFCQARRRATPRRLTQTRLDLVERNTNYGCCCVTMLCWGYICNAHAENVLSTDRLKNKCPEMRDIAFLEILLSTLRQGIWKYRGPIPLVMRGSRQDVAKPA